MIVLDAFSKSYVPFHLMTVEFYKLLSDKLSNGGVVISNHIGSPSNAQATSDLYRANLKTFLQVFPKVFVFLTDHSKSLQNIILASVKGGQIDEYDISDKFEIANLQESTSKVIEEIDYQDYVLENNLIDKNDVPIITDQYAPVEKLLDPISSKPYSIEEQSNNKSSSFGVKVNSSSIAILSLPAFLFIIMTITWIFFLMQIWKNNSFQ
jgi:hypothetical protein